MGNGWFDYWSTRGSGEKLAPQALAEQAKAADAKTDGEVPPVELILQRPVSEQPDMSELCQVPAD